MFIDPNNIKIVTKKQNIHIIHCNEKCVDCKKENIHNKIHVYSHLKGKVSLLSVISNL